MQRNDDEMAAYALEVSPKLLPFIPELLQDFEELGSDAEAITSTLAELGISKGSTIIDLGCGKGAVAVEAAKRLGCKVIGIELFKPFIPICLQAAKTEGVNNLCTFRQGNIEKMAGTLEPADAVVYASLGDVLGDFSQTVDIIRTYVRPGGLILIADSCLRDNADNTFPGFENYRTLNEMSALLTVRGDKLIQSRVLESAGDDSAEVENIRKRAVNLARRRPELEEDLMRFVKDQANEYKYLAGNMLDVIWVLQKLDRRPSPG